MKRRLAALWALALLLAPAPSRADRIDVALEKAVGEAVVATLEGASGTIDDPLVAAWAKRVGARVAAGASGPIRPRFVVLNSAIANAWTAPGGTILVTRGLLESVDSDDELAAVLAHECAHVSRRHAWQQLSENALALGLIGLLRRQSQTVRTGAVVANVLRALGRSRAMESQADSLGAEFTLDGGYDPRGMFRFLDGAGTRRRSDLETWLSTHPDSGTRLKALESGPLTLPGGRERLSGSLRERGLPRAAERARTGADLLALPSLAPTADPEGRREGLAKRADALLQRLHKGAPVASVASGMQQLLLFNTPLTDIRAVVLAGRGYAVQQRVADAQSRTARCAQVALGVWDRLAESDRVDREVGRGEVARAVDLAGETLSAIERAQSATALVLANLNLRVGGGRRETDKWLRAAAQEGLLRYAESELNRVDERAAEAWRYLSIARIRAYSARLDQLAPAGDSARRALWRGLLERRAGRGPVGGGPVGDETVRTLVAAALGTDDTEASAGRSETAWADWAARRGVAEPVAVALRLLTLDLERETADPT